MELPPLPKRGMRPSVHDDRINLEAEFHKIGERRGYLGASNGTAAYAYVRVSSETQMEEGRSGLPRQLLHIHELALKGVPEKAIPPLRVTWDMVYADEGYSGFEFRNRPSLTALLDDIQHNQRSPYILFEHIDRLSRHATWHQGFLLEQIERAGCTPVFWRAYNSAIERSVMGAIAEQGMKHEIQRMMTGQVLKAKDGRVTAKRPRFGYMFVNSKGEPQDRPATDTHYAPHPVYAPIIQWVYRSLIHDRKSLGEIVKMMNAGTVPFHEGPVPTGRGAKAWHVATLANMVKNPAYKGEFYARRHFVVPTGNFNDAGREVLTLKERERDEWIRVDIPALVTPEEWATAQKRLDENRKRSPRNTKRRDWLLSGLIRCARCGYAWNSLMGGGPNRYHRYYGCVSRYNPKAKELGIACEDRRYIRAETLESAVWKAVLEIIMSPDLILETMGEQYTQFLAEYESQRAFLTSSLAKLDSEFNRWNSAYASGIIDLSELRGYRSDISKKREALKIELDDLTGRIQRVEGLRDRDTFVREMLAMFREALEGSEQEPASTLQRKVLQMLLDTIWINDQTMEVKVEGVVSSNIDLQELGFESSLSR